MAAHLRWFKFVAKAELFRIPLFGPAMRYAGMIPIERQNQSRARASIHQAGVAIEGGASVIGLASMTSFFGNEYVPGYGAAKAGLAQLTKTLAIAWAADGIRVNAVAAGLIRSNMTAAMLADEALTTPFMSRVPLARVGTPHDIAGAVLFLSSPAASYITGSTLVVDGGFSIRG